MTARHIAGGFTEFGATTFTAMEKLGVAGDGGTPGHPWIAELSLLIEGRSY